MVFNKINPIIKLILKKGNKLIIIFIRNVAIEINR